MHVFGHFWRVTLAIGRCKYFFGVVRATGGLGHLWGPLAKV